MLPSTARLRPSSPLLLKEGCRRSRRGGWCGSNPTPPPAFGRPLLMRGGENDCEVGMLFEGGVSAKPTGWLVWIYTHTTPGLRPTPPHERRGKRLRSRDALPLLFSRRGVGEADGVVGVDLPPHHPPACGRPLLMRGGENDCEVGMLFPSFSEAGEDNSRLPCTNGDIIIHENLYNV